MSDRLEFDVVCPNNHNKAIRFSKKEFEDTLKAGAMVLHCNTCDTNWSLSKEEIAKIRKHLGTT